MNVSAISIVKSHIVFFFIVSFGVCAKKQYVVMSVAHIAGGAMAVGSNVRRHGCVRDRANACGRKTRKPYGLYFFNKRHG